MKAVGKVKAEPDFSMKSFNQQTNKITRLIDSNATLEQKMLLKKNVLIILDDVISEIKHNEHNSMLCQLFLNRRHLIANGTVSFVLIS